MADLWHNCVVHPLCGLLWAFGPRRAKRFADRWHAATSPFDESAARQIEADGCTLCSLPLDHVPEDCPTRRS
jgi:hypothetical protein